MGWITDKAQDSWLKPAREAWESGDQMFATVLDTVTPGGAAGRVRQARNEWGHQLNLIEAVGWRLEHWSVINDPRGHITAYPVFRRP